jgi:hypothetical protein
MLFVLNNLLERDQLNEAAAFCLKCMSYVDKTDSIFCRDQQFTGLPSLPGTLPTNRISEVLANTADKLEFMKTDQRGFGRYLAISNACFT